MQISSRFTIAIHMLTCYDVHHAREVLDTIKPLVNEYVEFLNTESKDETHLLLQVATYFDSLKQDGYIAKSIPNSSEYCGEIETIK